RRHGESSAIVSLLTEGHGRHLGLVRGGAGRRAAGTYEPGNEVAARWRARLDEHLGTYTCEVKRAHAAAILDDPLRLSGLAAACAVADAALPEREPHGAVFESLKGWLESVAAAPTMDWASAYVRFELGMLRDLGFGLDLSGCAVTGTNDTLSFVSPKTGRAVSAAAAEPYRDRLLTLPSFLLDPSAAALSPAEVLEGLRLTGHFLDRHVFAPHERKMPAARARLVDRLSRSATIS
ncbi:MAG: DNA repair protein RecO, partial [Alphaproteobacteria bacterium]